MKPEQDQNQSFLSLSQRVQSASREDIENLFNAYDFRDPLGHRLTLCQDFQDLLSRIDFSVAQRQQQNF